jgi:hypothetical protein
MANVDWRSVRARRAAAKMASGGPWQWQWRRRHRRGRAVGCLLWALTLVVVLLVLSLLFGGFQRGKKTGGTRPPSPVTAQHAAAHAGAARISRELPGA